VIDGGSCGTQPTTVLDLTGEAPQLVRRGCGEVEGLGLTEA
jgi:tRNA A37 threonylcarbamoyladenosine synthetase subunit TsaC/SUA5/YrdC